MCLRQARCFVFAFVALACSTRPTLTSAQVPNNVTALFSVTGSILDDSQHPVGAAAVNAYGPITRSASSASDGTFRLSDLPAGLYRVVVSKAGFGATNQDDVVVASGITPNLRFTLTAASLTSISTIGRVSSGRAAANLNTSSASVATISGSTFIDQGQLTVKNVLNEEPGIIVSPPSNNGGNGFLANASSPLSTGIAQIRGALPYETASLIDGHPISLGEYGTFNPVFLNPYMLQNVEVVKGPGAQATNINYAIGGTVNYRTLEPTARPQQSFDVGYDQFGGQQTNVRATGTIPGGHLSYAFDYATQGTQGFDRGFTTDFAPVFFLGPTTINGRPLCGNPAAGGFLCDFTIGRGNPKNYFGQTLGATFVLGNQPAPMNSYERNELTKVRYTFSPSTALTLTYLGAQSRGSEVGALLFTLPGTTFTPPAGYTGALAPGSPIPFDIANSIGSLAETNANLFEAELRTAVSKTTTLLAREYIAGVQTFTGGPGDSGPANSALNLIGPAYGGAPLNQDLNPTAFNGNPNVTLTTLDPYSAIRSYDVLKGETVEIDQQAGANLFSLSYDQVHTTTNVESENALMFLNQVPVPAGSGQIFRTAVVRGQLGLSSRVTATLSNYLTSYTDTYTQNGGATFTSSTQTYDAPRLALAYRPNTQLSVRAATGLSIAPPYVNLLTNSSAVNPSQIQPPTYYTTTATSGNLKPETAFGFDFGFDARVHATTIVSIDAYQTTLHNQYLTTTFQDGLYTPRPGSRFPPTPEPLFVTQTQNLGHSRYEGLEAALHDDPLRGFGYRVQGALIRAYPYDLPANFYSTAAGPNTTNLGVLANTNFQGGGFQFNGLSTSRVPYSQGYAELNYRTREGAFGQLGLTYYGANNGYNEPAFGVVNASYNQPILRNASLQLSIANLTNAYGNDYYNFFGGVPVSLKNGLLGLTPGNVIGPSTASLVLHVRF